MSYSTGNHVADGHYNPKESAPLVDAWCDGCVQTHHRTDKEGWHELEHEGSKFYYCELWSKSEVEREIKERIKEYGGSPEFEVKPCLR